MQFALCLRLLSKGVRCTPCRKICFRSVAWNESAGAIAVIKNYWWCRHLLKLFIIRSERRVFATRKSPGAASNCLLEPNEKILFEPCATQTLSPYYYSGGPGFMRRTCTSAMQIRFYCRSRESSHAIAASLCKHGLMAVASVSQTERANWAQSSVCTISELELIAAWIIVKCANASLWDVDTEKKFNQKNMPLTSAPSSFGKGNIIWAGEIVTVSFFPTVKLNIPRF